MTESEVLAIITADSHPDINSSVGEITRVLARAIANIAPKLTDAEISELLCVAVALYQKGFEEFQATVDTRAVLREMKKKSQDS